MKHTVTQKPNSLIEISGEIPWSEMSAFEDTAFKKLADQVHIDGFRPGNVPADIARKHVPDHILLADMAELAINDMYPKFISENTLDVIGRPEVAITKIARDNPLGFTITTAVVPTIELPDYKKIGASIAPEEAADVTSPDVDKVIENLRQMRAYGHVHAEGDEHAHEQALPEVTDEFAQSFGNFKTVEDLRAKVRENLMQEAEHAVKDKRRVRIMEDIIKETNFDVPEILINSEAEKMFAQIEADVARSGGTIDDYLASIKKTKAELLIEFKPEAEKRARFQLVLHAIARKEQALPTEAEVETEAQKYMAMYPGADLNRTRAYADMVLTNEKVLQLLEGK